MRVFKNMRLDTVLLTVLLGIQLVLHTIQKEKRLNLKT